MATQTGGDPRKVPVMSHARLSIALLLLLAAAPARALDPNRPLLDAVHEVWTKANGLPSNGVRALAQTSDGYLWLGFDNALARFDGARFVSFDKHSMPRFDGQGATKLMASSDGALWIGSVSGLTVYRDYQFRPIPAWYHDRTATVFDIDESPGGRILVSTVNGIGVVEGDALVPFFQGRPEDAPVCPEVELIDNDSVICVGYELSRVERTHVTRLRAAEQFSGASVASTRDAQGRVWISGRSPGLLRGDGQRFDPVTDGPGLPSGIVMAMKSSSNRSIYFVGSFGLAAWHDNRADHLPAAEILNASMVSALLEDREGSLWLATDNGLQRFRDGAVVPLTKREGLPDQSVVSVFIDRNDTLWLGTNSGLYRRTRTGWQHFGVDAGLPATGPVLSLGEDNTGTLWASVVGAGLFQFDGFRFIELPRSEALREKIGSAIVPASDGGLWLGGSYGLARLQGLEATRIPVVSPGQTIPMVLVIHEAAPGSVWVGTGDLGAIEVDNGERVVWGPEQGLHGPTVVGFHKDKDGALWIAGLGLSRFKDGKLMHVPSDAGLPIAGIASMQADAGGESLWLGSDIGVTQVQIADLNVFFAGAATKIPSRTFGRNEGFRSGECSGGGQNAAARSADGRLWFVATTGVVSIDPAHVPRNDVPPEPLIETLHCGETEIDLHPPEGAPQVPPGARNCELRYTANSLRVPSAVTFRYRLVGEDRDWVDTGARRSAYFSSLSPGTHTIEVMASNEDGVVSSAPATLRFHQRPLWYQTWWFYGAALLGAGALAWGAHRTRLRAVERQRLRLEVQVSDRTRELNEVNRSLEQRVQAGIDKLRDTERLAAYGQMVAGVAHEVRHPVFALRTAAYMIGQKAQPIFEEIKLPLETMRTETDRITRLMDDLLQFAREPVLTTQVCDLRGLCQAAATSYRAVHGDTPAVQVEAPESVGAVLDRDRVTQVLINLIDNARKHAKGCTRVVLQAGDDGSHVTLRVTNDGRGISTDNLPHIFEPFYTGGGGTGLGLSIVERLIKAHGGTITVDSSIERGTCFTIALPKRPPGREEHA